MSTPHIWVHVTVEAGEERDIEVRAGAGPYRLRTLEFGPEADIEYDGGPSRPSVTPTAGAGRPTLAAGQDHAAQPVVPSPHLRGRGPALVQDALTADRMATLQAFRDLFSTEILRPGDEVAIGRVTLLFSDLKGSTAMYEAVGDAAAYRLVRAHFAYLAAIIREHDGAIVKTIGDAVMAAFHDPLQGLRAAIAMQERVAEFNAANPNPIVLKLGLHEGPCIAVTLNDRLDYFGQTVNLTARLQGESEGGDVVVSAPLARSLARCAAAGPPSYSHRERPGSRGIRAGRVRPADDRSSLSEGKRCASRCSAPSPTTGAASRRATGRSATICTSRAAADHGDRASGRRLPAVCLFVNDVCDAEVLEILAPAARGWWRCAAPGSTMSTCSRPAISASRSCACRPTRRTPWPSSRSA